MRRSETKREPWETQPRLVVGLELVADGEIKSSDAPSQSAEVASIGAKRNKRT